jgi:hypothetical protein
LHNNKCRVKPWGWGILKISGLDEVIAQPCILGICPHPWAKIIMNQTYVDHKAYEWEGYYAYSSIVGGFLHL